MAGIELYAPRTPRHRRTWTAAALVLAVVFIILGQTFTAVPGLMLGFLTMNGQSVGWAGTAFSLFGFAATALIVVGWVTLFERRNLRTIGFNSQALKRFARGYGVGLAFLLVVVAATWFFLPIWTGQVITWEQWHMRMWLPTWV